MMRIAMFAGTNIAVMIVFSIITSVFQIDRLFGLDGQMSYLLVYAAVAGFLGSFISLLMSKSAAKRSMGVQLIEQPGNETERWLLDVVHEQAKQADIGMPEVGIFQSPAPNAFATGWNKNKALVAVSTGLLSSMSRKEVEAVLGHEMAHVYNGDMVTMGLVQGVLNTFVFFFARILGMFIDGLLRGNRGGGYSRGIGYWIGSMIGNVVFGMLASFVAAWFSRQREYRADAGGAKLAGRENMIDALKALQGAKEPEAELPGSLAAFGISGGKIASLRSTHPALADRIARLESSSSSVARV